MKFIRYGSLVPQHHTIPKKEDEISYHTPPVEKGFYAFPHGFVEEFLLGGRGAGSVKNGRYSYYRENGKVVIVHSLEEFLAKEAEIKSNHKEFRKRYFTTTEYEELPSVDKSNKDHKILIENKPSVFNYDGLIWHHFVCSKKRYEHIRVVRDWALDDIRSYKNLLEKYIASCKYNVTKDYGIKGHYNGFPISKFDKIDFEVYIQSIQKTKKQLINEHK